MAKNGRPWSSPQIIWSGLIAIVDWSAVGFSWFGQGFGWMTLRSATQMSSTAVTESLAGICVAQAQGAPDAANALTQFAEPSSWKQLEFVEAARWAMMPGGESTQGGVGELCVTKLRRI